MWDINLGDYAWAISPIIACIALFVSIRSYRLARSIKALDLRLELEKAFNELDIVVSDMDGYLQSARASHVRVLAASGLIRSSAMDMFEKELANDQEQLRQLLESRPQREKNYDQHKPSDLASLIVAVHGLLGKLSAIRGKYRAVQESDEQRRKEVRAEYQFRR